MEIRIILDQNAHQDQTQLPHPEHAARAGAWCAERGHYATARAFLQLAQALEIDNYAEVVATAGRGLVSVPIIGSTREEQPRTHLESVAGFTDAAHRPVARATCLLCSELIWAYAWEREPVDGSPAAPAGRLEFTDWRHSHVGAEFRSNHDPVPVGGSVVAGPLPDEPIVGSGEH